MPTASLVPISLSDPNANVASGAFTDIDNTIAGASGTLLSSIINNWVNQPGVGSAFTFGLTNVPGDYDTLNSVDLTVRAQVTGTLDNDTLTFRSDISGTNAPANVVDWVETDAGAALANRNFLNSTVTPSGADIDGWIVRVYQQVWTQNMGKDGMAFAIDEIEIVIDYNAAFPADVEASLALRPVTIGGKTATSVARANLALRAVTADQKTIASEIRAALATRALLDGIVAPSGAFPYRSVAMQRRDIKTLLTR